MDVVNSKDVALWDMPADGDVPLCHWATSTLKNALSILFRPKIRSCSRQIFACDFLIADRLPRLLNIEAGRG